MSRITIIKGERSTIINFKTKEDYNKNKQSLLKCLELKENYTVVDPDSKTERFTIFPIEYLQNSMIEFEE